MKLKMKEYEELRADLKNKFMDNRALITTADFDETKNQLFFRQLVSTQFE